MQFRLCLASFFVKTRKYFFFGHAGLFLNHTCPICIILCCLYNFPLFIIELIGYIISMNEYSICRYQMIYL